MGVSTASEGLSATSVVLLGPDMAHRRTLQVQLDGHVSELRVLPDSFSFVRPELTSTPARLRRRIDELTRTRHRAYLSQVLDTVDDARTDLVVAYWGTLVVPDLVALRRARPGLRLVLMVLTHPLSTDRFGVARQQWRMAGAARVVDGFVVPTEAMAGWFRARLPTRRRPPVAVVRPCWPAALQAGVRPPSVGDRPNVIFLGRSDPSGPTAVGADDVGPQLRALLEAGVEVHHARSAEWDDAHPLRHQFAHRSVPDLLATAAGHDASVVTYAVPPGAAPLRFELSVPDRLISSCAAGVPVALPSTGYGALAEYLGDYGAVIRYHDAAHLAAQLHDRDSVAARRDRAWQARTAYTAESHGPALRSFLATVG